MAASALSITGLLGKISYYIINPLILLVFAVAFLTFVYGIFQFINSETADASREDGKRKILWGLVGMAIMFSAYGLIHAIISTIPCAGDVCPKSNTGYIQF